MTILTLRLKICSAILSASIILQSCSSSSPFTEKELKWFNPFSKVDTSIFVSENGLRDTIIFLSVDTTIFKTRNFEQGFRNEKTLRVRYTLTQNSYHKFSLPEMKIDNLISLLDDDNWTKHSIEISFLGSVYDNSFVDKLQSDNQVVHFDEANAVYQGMNISERIKSFDFDFKKGIVGFIDKFNRKWHLK